MTEAILDEDMLVYIVDIALARDDVETSSAYRLDVGKSGGKVSK